MLCRSVDPLCRLIQKKNFRRCEQQLGKRAFLLLAAAEIKRMALQKMRNAELICNGIDLLRALGTRHTVVFQHIVKVGPHRILEKHG